ncbi:MAG: hypothetical protein HYR55_09860 [Acidobacteria bacterium]|nr:hypothetical protein [Acidobacteriota bacterium]MBI3658715.1 hypothetical protein [Acidobacteriota bacterium]
MRIQISFTRELTLAAISGAAEYFEIIESQLGSAKSSEKSRIQKMVKSWKLNAEDEYAEWSIAMKEHQATFDMLLPNYFRYSFIALLLLIVENKLADLCYAAKAVRKLDSEVPQPRRDVIKEYKSYISDKAHISGLNWDALQELGKVRNCIVHASGKIKGYRDKSFLTQLARKRAGLHINEGLWDYEGDLQPLFLENHILVIEPEYCRYAVGTIKAFFEDICDKIPLPKLVIGNEY